jgi:hypothetical protein
VQEKHVGDDASDARMAMVTLSEDRQVVLIDVKTYGSLAILRPFAAGRVSERASLFLSNIDRHNTPEIPNEVDYTNRCQSGLFRRCSAGARRRG